MIPPLRVLWGSHELGWARRRVGMARLRLKLWQLLRWPLRPVRWRLFPFVPPLAMGRTAAAVTAAVEMMVASRAG